MSKPIHGDGLLIITDLPSQGGIDFGIDFMTYETVPSFQGISLIPQGLHLIYYSSGMGPRQGFFIDMQRAGLEVRSWNSSNEEILPTNILSDASFLTLQQSINRGDLNSSTVTYPYNQYSTWKRLSSLINSRVLKTLECDCTTLLYPGDVSDIDDINVKLIQEKNKTSMTTYFPGHAKIVRWSDLILIEASLKESINREHGKSAALTELNLNKSPILSKLILNCHNGNQNDLLGELQLSFILFLTLFSFPALQQWKALIHLICNCGTYIEENISFTLLFTKILYEQLNYIPADFFEEEFSKENFLLPCLSSFFSNLNMLSETSPIYENKRRLLVFVKKRFNLFNDSFICEKIQNKSVLKAIVNLSLCGDEAFNVNDEDFPEIIGYYDEKNDYTPLETYFNLSSENNLYKSTEDTIEIVEINENTKYSWRYPLLFDSMKSSGLNEDLIMAATRIIEEFGNVTNNNSTINCLIQEAKMFIEFEVKNQTNDEKVN